MKFLYPEFLWALFLLIIPVIIHLFNFKRYKTLYFSSLNFIKHVDQQTKSTQKLKHLLILASRMLAFTFLILAFAQPYFEKSDTNLNSKQHVSVIYLDNSYSMQARGAEGELLSEAREKAKELINEEPMNAHFMILTNELDGREERILNKIEALEKVDNTNYSPLTRGIADVVTWKSEKLNKKSKDDNIGYSSTMYLFSDFQKSTNTLASRIDSLNGDYYPIQLVAENNDNLLIDSVWYTSPNHLINQRAELNFRVRNNSDVALENVELNIQLDDLDKTVFVNVPKNGAKTSSITYSDKSYGTKKGQITVVDKHIFFDDKFYFSYQVHPSADVLIIDGEDKVNNIELIYNLDEFYKTSSVNLNQITREDLANKDLIILNGVNDLSTGIQTYLEEFRSTGGSILLFPGKSPNMQSWNVFLRKSGLAQLGKVIASGNKINHIEYNDPVIKGIFAKESSNLNLPGVSKIYQAIKSGPSGNDILTMQNDLPLVSYAHDNGRTFMYYSSLSDEFGQFTKDALFSSLLLRIGELSKRNPPLYLEIGSNVKYPIYVTIGEDEAIHVKNDKIDFIPQHNELAGIHYLALNKLGPNTSLASDNYQIVANKEIGTISLNYNSNESQLTPLSEEEILLLFEKTDNQVKPSKISSNNMFSGADLHKPFAYWKICIVITLIFVAIEMLLIRFFK